VALCPRHSPIMLLHASAKLWHGLVGKRFRPSDEDKSLWAASKAPRNDELGSGASLVFDDHRVGPLKM
jgi:hypothetical protein